MTDEYKLPGMENEQIEYKKSTGELKEGIISMVAILNKHGSGKLYFGVKNDGTVIGQDVSDGTLRTISQTIKNNVTPTIFPEISIKELPSGKALICVRFEGDRQPYLAYKIPRIRIADEDLEMDQDTYAEMLIDRNSEKYSWENQTSRYTVADIDMEDFKSYLNKARSVERITFENDDPESVMEKLELMSDDGVHLLNAGAALFCDVSTNDVQMAKFATDVKTTFTDIRREDKGSIIGLSKVCEQYIIDAMDWKADIVGLQRIETPEVPVAAVREAIINSFGHRLYNNNQCNEIDIFKNRIEIHTTGGFPKGHKPEEFLSGSRKAIRRNKRITRVLYYSKDMETFATGLKRIKDLCDEAGVRLEFRSEMDDFVVIFYRNLREQWNKGLQVGSIITHEHASDHVGEHASDHVSEQVGKYNSATLELDLENKILEYCAIPRTRAEIQELIGISSRSYFMTNVLKPLLNSGKLKRTIPDNPRSANQKYINANI